MEMMGLTNTIDGEGFDKDSTGCAKLPSPNGQEDGLRPVEAHSGRNGNSRNQNGKSSAAQARIEPRTRRPTKLYLQYHALSNVSGSRTLYR